MDIQEPHEKHQSCFIINIAFNARFGVCTVTIKSKKFDAGRGLDS